jgi:hypothetical protein
MIKYQTGDLLKCTSEDWTVNEHHLILKVVNECYHFYILEKGYDEYERIDYVDDSCDKNYTYVWTKVS